MRKTQKKPTSTKKKPAVKDLEIKAPTKVKGGMIKLDRR